MMQHIDFKFLVVDIHLMISLQTFPTIDHVIFRMQATNTQRIQWEKRKSEKETDVIEEFFRNVRIKIIRNKEAHLLHNLLAYVKELSESYDIPTVVEHTVTLKHELQPQFSELIDFFPISKYFIVHASNMNTCQYSVSTLLGQGLRDKEYIRSYSNFIRSKVNQAEFPEQPYTPDQMIESLYNGPMPELYNTFYAIKYGPNFKINEYGYAITHSANIANKIWSIASDWQGLITIIDTPKQMVLLLSLHRITGSKESVNYIHKSGHDISYNKVSEKCIANFSTKINY